MKLAIVLSAMLALPLAGCTPGNRDADSRDPRRDASADRSDRSRDRDGDHDRGRDGDRDRDPDRDGKGRAGWSHRGKYAHAPSMHRGMPHRPGHPPMMNRSHDRHRGPMMGRGPGMGPGSMRGPGPMQRGPMTGRGPGMDRGGMMGRGPTSRPSPDEMFNRMDANKDGSVTREEFDPFHQEMRQEMEQRMRDFRGGRDGGRGPTTRGATTREATTRETKTQATTTVPF